jgi:hypothetical protein
MMCFMTENPDTPELCYICAEAIDPEDRDMDHVPPKGLFNIKDRANLIKLPTHRACNQSFAKDDEYFRLQITARALHDPKAKQLWGDPLPGTGPVMRGFHRPQSQGFKTSVLKDLIPVDLRTEGGIYLGSVEVMLQKADRIIRVVNRIVRGLYTRRTGKVLPADWPVSSELMDGAQLQPMLKLLNVRFFNIGKRTFLYDSKHLADDHREALFWLIFYNSVQFWGYTGTQIPSRLPWRDSPSLPVATNTLKP